MASTDKDSVEIEGELLERARRVARERGVEIPQLVHDALDEQPPLTFIGAFHSGRGDLSELASKDVFESEPFR